MSDWQTAAERLNRYVRQDHELGTRLASLGKQQARNDKLAFKLEEGRVYGLRQQYYNLKLQRQLGKEMRNPPVEPHW